MLPSLQVPMNVMVLSQLTCVQGEKNASIGGLQDKPKLPGGPSPTEQSFAGLNTFTGGHDKSLI